MAIAAPPANSPPGGRNIVICCDGTSNEYGDRNTNVVKLFAMLVKDPVQQLCFYDPGVGTFSAPAFFTKTGKLFSRVVGLGFGWGITQNVEDAYSFLMNNWRPDDRIYIFGFSRGAYTARAVAAMLRKVCLLNGGNTNLVPYASKIFKHEKQESVSSGFSRLFSRRCPVHFLGLWDTVKSIGWAWDLLTLPHTVNNNIVTHVRHAVAIDERRAFFRQHMWGPGKYGENVKQVWFAGVHCDVGGSYPERESGLSQLALEWMADEATSAGLLIDPAERRKLIPRPGSPVPPRQPGEPEPPEPPNPLGMMHESLKGIWVLAEFYPKMFFDPADDWRKKYRANLFSRRFIPVLPKPLIHESVFLRIRQDPSYRPENIQRLGQAFHTEPWPSAPGGTPRPVQPVPGSP